MLFPVYSQNKLNNKLVENYLKKYDLYFYSNIDSSFFYLNKAERLSTESKNNYLISKTALYLCRYNNLILNKKKALQYCKRSLTISKQNKFDSIYVASIEQLGYINFSDMKYSKALQLFIEASKIADQKKLLSLKVKLLIRQGTVYFKVNQFDNAIKCYHEAENLAINNNFKSLLSETYYFRGNVYMQQRHFNKANSVYKKGLEISIKIKDVEKQHRLYLALINVNVNTNNHEEALQYLNTIRNSIKNIKENKNLIYIYSFTADIYEKLQKPNLAIDQYLKAIMLSKKYKQLNPERDSEFFLSNLFEQQNKPKEALLHLRNYQLLQDSIISLETSKAVNEIQTKYDVEIKNSKIKSLTQEKEKEKLRKIWIFTISLVLVLSLVTFVFIYRQRVKNQKILREKEQQLFEIEKNKLEQEAQFKKILGIVEGQDGERNRIATEMHDGLAGKLSSLKMQLSYKNKQLNDGDIQNSIKNLDEILGEIRSISHNLSQNFITSRSFCELFQHLKRDFEVSKEIIVELNLFPILILNKIEGECKKNCYRIIQELLNNTIKHAKASLVSININLHSDELIIIYEDNGIGIANQLVSGIGLKNIEERIKMMKGTIEIDKNIRIGFCTLIKLPNPLISG